MVVININHQINYTKCYNACITHTIVCGNLVCTNFVSVCDFVMCTQAHQILIGLNKSFHTIDVVFSKLYRMLKHIDLKVCIPDIMCEVTYLLRTILEYI